MYIPWKLKRALELATNIYHFITKWSFKPHQSVRRKATFICRFHGKTGGTQAIASIANMLSHNFDIFFLSYPTSHINSLVSKSVKLVNKLNVNSDIYICDLSIDIKTLKRIKNHNKTVIVSIHGLKNELHSLSQDHINNVLSLVDKVHFVSDIQQNSYQLNKESFFIIPNTSTPIKKTRQTNNIGSVGNLNSLRKGASQTVSIGLASNASCIHLWNIESNAFNNKRVVCHNWESNKEKIFNSFDILVFMSESETFGLVVIEAMSAGIPCLLSPLEVFEQFTSCPGIIKLDSLNKKAAVVALNSLLINKKKLSPLITQHYQKYYSTDAILHQWDVQISHIINSNLLS